MVPFSTSFLAMFHKAFHDFLSLNPMKNNPTHLPLEKAIRRITGATTTTKGFPLLRSLMRATLTALGHHPETAENTLTELLNHWRRVGITAEQVADLRLRNLAMPRRGLRPK